MASSARYDKVERELGSKMTDLAKACAIPQPVTMAAATAVCVVLYMIALALYAIARELAALRESR